MASLRRNNIVAADYPMSKFLYTMLKQFDLKSVNWIQVASECEITNGHAARMRYSRFKQVMEGTAPSTRKQRGPNKSHGEIEKSTKIQKSRAPRKIKKASDLPKNSQSFQNNSSLALNEEQPLIKTEPQPSKMEVIQKFKQEAMEYGTGLFDNEEKDATYSPFHNNDTVIKQEPIDET